MAVNATIAIVIGVTVDLIMCGEFGSCKQPGEAVFSAVFNGVFGAVGLQGAQKGACFSRSLDRSSS